MLPSWHYIDSQEVNTRRAPDRTVFMLNGIEICHSQIYNLYFHVWEEGGMPKNADAIIQIES